jgi:hypothetical protein
MVERMIEANGVALCTEAVTSDPGHPTYHRASAHARSSRGRPM